MSSQPPLRIQRTAAPAAPPKPKPQPKPKPAPKPQPQPKGPAPPKKQWPPATPVATPQRLSLTVSRGELQNGIMVCNARWGCPFRTAEIDGKWHVIWVGSEMGLKAYKPPGWTDVACGSRDTAGQLAFRLFADWIQSPGCSKLLARAKECLQCYNLICRCKPGRLCHADVLIAIVNAPDQPAG